MPEPRTLCTRVTAGGMRRAGIELLFWCGLSIGRSMQPTELRLLNSGCRYGLARSLDPRIGTTPQRLARIVRRTGLLREFAHSFGIGALPQSLLLGEFEYVLADALFVYSRHAISLISLRMRRDRKEQMIVTYFKLREACALLTVFALSGCASTFWQQDPDWVDYRPTQISVVEHDDPSQVCGVAPRSLLACAIRHRDTNNCVVAIKSGLTHQAYTCTIMHEARHCFGGQHNARSNYAIDCGNGDIYTPKQQDSQYRSKSAVPG